MGKIYSKIKIPLWLILSGLLTSLPLFVTELGFLQWISVIPAAIILIRYSLDESVKLRKIYGMGVLFFGFYYALSFHWFFYMYPLDFAGLSNAASLGVVLIACFGLGFFQAVQSAVLFLIFGFISRSALCEKHRMILPFCAASLWVIFEWWQTFGWWGVPWARLPLGQIDAGLFVRSSSLLGSYFVTFTIIAVNFSLAIALSEKALMKLGAVVAALVFCLNLALGSIVTLMYEDSDGKITVASAQGNFASGDKWDSNNMQTTLNVYADLTERAADDGAKLIVWPETALPYVLFENTGLVSYARDLARDNDITIILSAFTRDEETGKKYNSIIEVRPDGSFGETVYSKQRLVPFGEFVPMREFVTFIFPPLANIGMLEEDLMAGEKSEVIESNVGNIGCGLCFDSIYENVMINSVRNGAEIIAISTNDSWFSDSAALDMHNAQARLRAIETGRYVIRSANTGISSIIDPMGNVKEELGALERGYIVSDVTMRNETTLYAYIGNLFVYVCAVFVLGMMLLKTTDQAKSHFIKKY